MKNAVALEKPPLERFFAPRAARRRNPAAGARRVRKNRLRMRQRASVSPVFANGAITSAFAYAARLAVNNNQQKTSTPQVRLNSRSRSDRIIGSSRSGLVNVSYAGPVGVYPMTVDEVATLKNLLLSAEPSGRSAFKGDYYHYAATFFRETLHNRSDQRQCHD